MALTVESKSKREAIATMITKHSTIGRIALGVVIVLALLVKVAILCVAHDVLGAHGLP